MSVLIKTCADIIAELIEAHEAGKDVNLNAVRQRVAKRNKVSTPALNSLVMIHGPDSVMDVVHSVLNCRGWSTSLPPCLRT
jgi:hypothetical protein